MGNLRNRILKNKRVLIPIGAFAASSMGVSGYYLFTFPREDPKVVQCKNEPGGHWVWQTDQDKSTGSCLHSPSDAGNTCTDDDQCSTKDCIVGSCHDIEECKTHKTGKCRYYTEYGFGCDWHLSKGNMIEGPCGDPAPLYFDPYPSPHN